MQIHTWAEQFLPDGITSLFASLHSRQSCTARPQFARIFGVDQWINRGVDENSGPSDV